MVWPGRWCCLEPSYSQAPERSLRSPVVLPAFIWLEQRRFPEGAVWLLWWCCLGLERSVCVAGNSQPVRMTLDWSLYLSRRRREPAERRNKVTTPQGGRAGSKWQWYTFTDRLGKPLSCSWLSLGIWPKVPVKIQVKSPNQIWKCQKTTTTNNQGKVHTEIFTHIFSSVSFRVENIQDCCKAQWVCVDQRIVLYKSYLLLLFLFLKASLTSSLDEQGKDSCSFFPSGNRITRFVAGSESTTHTSYIQIYQQKLHNPSLVSHMWLLWMSSSMKIKKQHSDTFHIPVSVTWILLQIKPF